MDFQLVLLISRNDKRDDERYAAIEEHVHAIDCRVMRANACSASDAILQATQARCEPAAAIIGPDVQEPIAVARRIRSALPIGQMLFVPASDQLDRLRKELRHAPMIGTNWSLIELDDPLFVQRLQRAVDASRQRVRLRTTLDRANFKLSAPKPVDSLEYRRLVVSEHYLAKLLEQSEDAIVSLDARDIVLFWSKGAERLFGCNASMMIGKAAAQLPFWSSELGVFLKQIHNGARSATVETSYAVQGTQFDLEVLLSAVHDSTGELVGTSLALRDVTARNRLLERERAARREAERMSKMKDEFLAILSHELRTPLSTVIGRTQLLQMRYHNDPELLEALSIIERNAQMQSKLIEDLLDVSSIITGKLKLDKQTVHVQQLIDAAMESVRAAAAEKQIHLTKVVRDTHGTLHADAHRLQQVLFNLLVNAVKFTPAKGAVEVAAQSSSTSVDISVTDTGIGIAPDFLPYVFDRFWQEDATTTRRFGGLGLGLSIAKQIVELHGGTIHAFSAGRDRGACLRISLPARLLDESDQRHSPLLQAPGPQSSATLSGVRVLVVEDVADARDIVAEALQAYGADVLAVDSAPAALEALESFRPNVLVSDIAMPEMDGFELLKRIRSQGYASDKLPAIALTAFASATDRARVLLGGFQERVAKPLIVPELVDVVRKSVFG